MVFKEFLEGFGVDVKRGVVGDLALDHLDDVRGDFLGLLPVLFVPGLKVGNVARRADLDVQFNVLREAGDCEIAGADKGD